MIIAKQTSGTFTNLIPGTYLFKVTDANGCYYTESMTIDPVINIVFYPEGTHGGDNFLHNIKPGNNFGFLGCQLFSFWKTGKDQQF